MGSGNKGLYRGAYTGDSVPGSANYMKPNDLFSKYIQNRKDVDTGGFYDVIAHGTENRIIIENNGVEIVADHRIVARLLKANKEYNHSSIRLLSCNTGKESFGFAQNLANKLNRTGKLEPDYSKPGRFITFYPYGRRRK